MSEFSYAFKLGMDAHDRGDELELNPYDNGDARSDEWSYGWMAAYVNSK